MDLSKQNEIKKKLTGYEEQQILIDMLSEKIGEISGMHASTLTLFVTQALQDALDKRHVPFKKIKSTSNEEKAKFVDEIVIGAVKRAKLVNSVDEIMNECHKVYENWKKKYRPDELK